MELERADPADEGQEKGWGEGEDRSRRPTLLIRKSKVPSVFSFFFFFDARLAFFSSFFTFARWVTIDGPVCKASLTMPGPQQALS